MEQFVVQAVPGGYVIAVADPNYPDLPLRVNSLEVAERAVAKANDRQREIAGILEGGKA